jgi:hypothetical protein
LICSAGATLLAETARATGLDRSLRSALARWRAGRAAHDPGTLVLDLAVAIALGGDSLADVAVVRAQPEIFGPVASDPTVSRLIDVLAGDGEAAVVAIRAARASARRQAWAHRCPVPASGPVIVDLDATIVEAHSEKEGASPMFKRTFGFHPVLAFVDHGAEGTGEPLAALLREGRANANNAADQIALVDAALASSPSRSAAGCWCAGRPRPAHRPCCTTSPPRACSTRWASTPANRSPTRSPPRPGNPGGTRSTPTARPGTARRSPS